MAKQEIFFGINIDTGQSIKTFGELKKRTKELKNELDGLEVGSKRFNDLKAEITQNQATIRRFNRELRDTKSLATRVGQGMTNAFKRLGGVLVAAFAVDQILQYGKQIAELTSELSKLTNQVQQLTGVSRENAKVLANQAKALNQVYGVETQEVIKSATALAGQFGISFEEALNKINVGLAAGLDNNGQFLDILTEYPALLSEVGLNADETFAIINQSVTSGVYSDKGIDAIKEAGLRLRELPKATQDALNAIGLSASEIQTQLANGTTTVFDVIQKVSGRLKVLPPQSAEVGKAIADIFGGPGEDAGLKFLQTLEGIDTSFESITNNLTDYEKAQISLVDAQTNFNGVLNQFFGESSAGWTEIKASVIDFTANALRGAINGIVNLINGFIDLYNESSAFRGVLKGIGFAFETSFSIASTAIELTLGRFKTLFKAVDQAIRGNFTQAGEILRQNAFSAANSISDVSSKIAANFKETFLTEFTEKDKVDLLDFNTLTVSQQVTEKASELGNKTAKAYTDAFKQRANIELELTPSEDGETGLSSFIPKDDGDIEYITTLAQRLDQLSSVYDGVSASASSTSQALIQLASVQEEGSRSQETLIKASLRLNQALALSNAIVAISEIKKAFAVDLAKGFPANIVAVASTASVLATSLATIASAQSRLKQFQRGGVISGPSHANGGVPVKMANGGMVEAEGGEAIINKKNTALFAPILSAINSYGGNGDKFERGGIVSNGVPNSIVPPSTATSEIIRQIQSINIEPTVSVIEINEAQTRIKEINNNSTL